MTSRDEFLQKTIMLLATRAGHRCSNPDCQRETSGPASAPSKSINLGVAAHITAAAAGGPRYDASLTSARRAGAENGIWLCQTCAKLIDSDEPRYDVGLIRGWRTSAEVRAATALTASASPRVSADVDLEIPSTSPSTAWLAFSSRATALVGRDEEMCRLDQFLDANPKFAWWTVVGPAGAGKSRLALELCLARRPKWFAGFLGRTEASHLWSQFRPDRPTLVVVDYVATRVEETSSMLLQLARASASLPCPLRVLLLERDVDTWWTRCTREDSESEHAELESALHDEPMVLGGLPEPLLVQLGRDAAQTQGVAWSKGQERDYAARVRAVDARQRPLFAMIAVTVSDDDRPDALAAGTLLRRVLRKEAAHRAVLVPDAERRQRLEHLMALATLSGGLRARADSFDYLKSLDVAPVLPDPSFLDHGTFGEFASARTDDRTLPGFQPDILGERWMLDRLVESGTARRVARGLVVAAWRLQPADFRGFVVRCALDFAGDPALDLLCSDLPLDSPGARVQWGVLVGDIVHALGRSTYPLSARQLQALRELSAGHPSEVPLRHLLARAELSLANLLLFAERSFDEAARQFERVVALADPGSEIVAAAINNRGILHDLVQKEDNAFADWSSVIANPTASDEARACALNNRADVHVRRRDPELAIRDRTAVLSLASTSADRRYIALVRRSDSLVATGKPSEAIEDLHTILSTSDISPEQKAEARVSLGALLRDLDLLDDARVELELVMDAEDVFAGTRPDAAVVLADVLRLQQERDLAGELLDAASGAPDASLGTIIEGQIVRARLLHDDGRRDEADVLWKSVLANPDASPRQRAIVERLVQATGPTQEPTSEGARA